MRYHAKDHPVIRMIAWDPARPAERINDHILMVRAISNAYAVTGDDGDVVINAGIGAIGQAIRDKFEALLGRPLRVAKLIFTQSHPDHMGGWSAFADAGTEIIVQREFQRICDERNMLGPFFQQRNYNVLKPMLENAPTTGWFATPDPAPLTTFADEYSFSQSGREYRLLSVGAGETLDALAVWMPDEKTLFTGNWSGAIYGAFPAFYTPRGDRLRSTPLWLRQADRLMALSPEMLITGHEEPIRGAERIRADLTRLRDAVRHIHDTTVAGMVEGKRLSEIMANAVLPDRLVTAPGRGPIHWYARSVWEEYTGWFRQERTSELYATDASAVWPDIVELAGGPRPLAERAATHLRAGDMERALHLIEIAVSAAPEDASVRQVELSVYEALMARNAGRYMDELAWLEGRTMEIEAAIDRQAGQQ